MAPVPLPRIFKTAHPEVKQISTAARLQGENSSRPYFSVVPNLFSRSLAFAGAEEKQGRELFFSELRDSRAKRPVGESPMAIKKAS
jgi:hypothetical protein